MVPPGRRASTPVLGAHLVGALTAETAARNTGQLLRVVVDHQRPVITPLIVSGFAGYLTLFHRLDAALAAAPDTGGEHITTDRDDPHDQR